MIVFRLSRSSNRISPHPRATRRGVACDATSPTVGHFKVVINSGFTFRESANGSNSWQVAELPDYAVIDISVPADKRWPGKVALAGFFGEKWEVLATDGK